MILYKEAGAEMELRQAFETIRTATYEEIKELLSNLVIESRSDVCTEEQYIILWEIVRRNEARKRNKNP